MAEGLRKELLYLASGLLTFPSGHCHLNHPPVIPSSALFPDPVNRAMRDCAVSVVHVGTATSKQLSRALNFTNPHVLG